jgi:hypothetical protein
LWRPYRALGTKAKKEEKSRYLAMLGMTARKWRETREVASDEW